jgi:hypothetical protein
VTADEITVEASLLVLDRIELAHPDSGREPVDLLPLRKRTLDQLAGSTHTLDRLGRDLDPLAAASDANDLVQREPRPGESDAHSKAGAATPP